MITTIKQFKKIYESMDMRKYDSTLTDFKKIITDITNFLGLDSIIKSIDVQYNEKTLNDDNTSKDIIYSIIFTNDEYNISGEFYSDDVQPRQINNIDYYSTPQERYDRFEKLIRKELNNVFKQNLTNKKIDESKISPANKFLDLDDERFKLQQKLDLDWSDPNFELLNKRQRSEIEKQIKSIHKKLNNMKSKITEEDFSAIESVYGNDVNFEDFQENEWN